MDIQLTDNGTEMHVPERVFPFLQASNASERGINYRIKLPASPRFDSAALTVSFTSCNNGREHNRPCAVSYHRRYFNLIFRAFIW